MSAHTAETQPEPLLIEVLRSKNPQRDVLFTAFDTLKTEQDIQIFFPQYVQSLRNSADPQAVALENIGWLFGYYNDTTIALWRRALPQLILHPLFPLESDLEALLQIAEIPEETR